MLKTFRLWLEKDEEIPQFKRLKFEKIDIPLSDVVLRGIHPIQSGTDRTNLGDRFVEILNGSEMKPAELAQFKYCEDVSDVSTFVYCQDTYPFETLLRRIQGSVYFVESLSFVELLTIVKERLRRKWCHSVAYVLLSAVYPGFDQMRSFLKTKSSDIKLSGYADIERYDLGRILSLEDFEGEDGVLIHQGIPINNFRSAQFLRNVTDDRGFLRLTDSIRHFRINAYRWKGNYYDPLEYNCEVQRKSVVFRPELKREEAKRVLAREIASQWRCDSGRYRFTTSIEQAGKMIEQEHVGISFPTLDYKNPRDGQTSFGQVSYCRVPVYGPGKYLTDRSANEQIKDVLREHKVSMSGRKEQLVEKLAQLSVNIYRKYETELGDFFGRNRFVRIAGQQPRDIKRFPVLHDLDLRGMVLTMYILKHLRGNAVLEASHENDTFDLIDLARSLIKREVSLEGGFMSVA